MNKSYVSTIVIAVYLAPTICAIILTPIGSIIRFSLCTLTDSSPTSISPKSILCRPLSCLKLSLTLSIQLHWARANLKELHRLRASDDSTSSSIWETIYRIRCANCYRDGSSDQDCDWISNRQSSSVSTCSENLHWLPTGRTCYWVSSLVQTWG